MEPPARSRVREKSPPEAESPYAFVCLKEGPKLVAKMTIPSEYIDR